jgi:hypothetical protein
MNARLNKWAESGRAGRGRECPVVRKSSSTSPAYFHAQRLRPWIGVLPYTAAGFVGSLAPVVGLVLFVVMVAFHGLTSEGLPDAPLLRGIAPRLRRRSGR